MQHKKPDELYALAAHGPKNTILEKKEKKQLGSGQAEQAVNREEKKQKPKNPDL